jgi:hypothetical protein
VTTPPTTAPTGATPPTCTLTPTINVVQPTITLIEDSAMLPREYDEPEPVIAMQPAEPAPRPGSRLQNTPLSPVPVIHAGVADSASPTVTQAVAHMDYFTLAGITVSPPLPLPSPHGVLSPDMPTSPVTAAALALIDLSTTTVTVPTLAPVASTVRAPTTPAARSVPTPISYQDIVTSLERSAEGQGIRTRTARRRGGRSRPPMPRLPAAALRRPHTTPTPNLQMTIGTEFESREVRVQHDVHLTSLGDIPEL